MKCVIIAVVIGLVYVGVGIYWYMLNPALTSNTAFCSNSKEQSKKFNMYIGEYQPLQKLIKTKEGTAVNTKNAWIEHQYKFKPSTLYFITKIEKTNKYCLIIPPFSDANLPYTISVSLHRDGSSVEDGGSYPLGYQFSQLVIPDMFQIDVLQKDDVHNSWAYPIVVSTITYERAF